MMQDILNDLRRGRMIILTDHDDRENEGDLVCAAEMITPAVINFMIRQGSGIVCLALAPDIVKKLKLPLMNKSDNNRNQLAAPFTVSIEASAGVTTGVSADDRVKTILTAVADTAVPSDLVSPGHVFPLQARSGGVLEREGHTEGSVDLAIMAGLKGAAVICELMNPDGTMMKGEQLRAFAAQHQLKNIAIEAVKQHRLCHDNLIAEEAASDIPLNQFGKFHITVAREKYGSHEHIVLSRPAVMTPPLVRIHSSCATGDLFGSQRCDCRSQLDYSLERIAKEGGILIYLAQEGRGIGLFDKIKSYHLQDKGMDTVEANHALNHPADSRHYHIAACLLRNRGIHQIRLMTNNPHKLQEMQKYGISCQQETMQAFSNAFNLRYLQTKVSKLHHTINL